MYVINIRNITLLIFTLLTLSLFASQTEYRLLTEHQSVNAQIIKTEKHRYQIRLKQSQFAELRLSQLDADLMITTFNTKGEKLDVFDLTGRGSDELATITADVAGGYMIEIQSFTHSTKAANYNFEVKRISAKAKTAAEKVDQYLARWDSSTSPGLAVAVVKDGGLIYNKGVGLANLEYGIPITSETVFEVASISKQFTAFSILLFSRGR